MRTLAYQLLLTYNWGHSDPILNCFPFSPSATHLGAACVSAYGRTLSLMRLIFLSWVSVVSELFNSNFLSSTVGSLLHIHSAHVCAHSRFFQDHIRTLFFFTLLIILCKQIQKKKHHFWNKAVNSHRKDERMCQKAPPAYLGKQLWLLTVCCWACRKVQQFIWFPEMFFPLVVLWGDLPLCTTERHDGGRSRP